MNQFKVNVTKSSQIASFGWEILQKNGSAFYLLKKKQEEFNFINELNFF